MNTIRHEVIAAADGTRVHILPCLDDNYIYAVEAPGGASMFFVDASDGAAATGFAAEQSARVEAILVTHDHQDHVAGLAVMRKAFKCPVMVPVGARVPGTVRPVYGGETLQVGSMNVRVMSTPGHCTVHASYWMPEARVLFTGDCLFGAGCGRLLAPEPRPEEMWLSLRSLAALPDDTLVFPGHEYTVENLRFALACHPGDEAIERRRAQTRDVRSHGRPSVPSTMAEEKLTNPFLRAPDAATFAALRRKKDHF